MPQAVIIIAAIASTPLLMVAVWAVGQKLKRRQQVAFLTGPLRSSLKELATRPLPSPVIDVEQVNPAMPLALPGCEPVCTEALITDCRRPQLAG